MRKPREARPILERTFDCELRAAQDGDGLTLSGYAAKFNDPTRINSWEGLFDEQIAPGAFKRTIAARMPIMQWNHGHDPAVGQVPIGAITDLREDKTGLWVEARLHDNDAVKPIRDAVASGAVSGMSFRFEAVGETVDKEPDIPLRTLTEVKLYELGPVDFPAYESTTVGVRDKRAFGYDDDPDDYTACLNCGCLCDTDDSFCSRCGTALPALPAAAENNGEPDDQSPRSFAPVMTTRIHQARFAALAAQFKESA